MGQELSWCTGFCLGLRTSRDQVSGVKVQNWAESSMVFGTAYIADGIWGRRIDLPELD